MTSITLMLRDCLAFGERRRNPYSSEYSTMYLSSGQTKHQTRVARSEASYARFTNQRARENHQLQLVRTHYMKILILSFKISQ